MGDKSPKSVQKQASQKQAKTSNDQQKKQQVAAAKTAATAGGEYLRIVRLERLEVEYKSLIDSASLDGTHHTVRKKEFCRLLKNATLLTQQKIGEQNSKGD